MSVINLDGALAELGGFGKYQIKRVPLLCLLGAFTAFQFSYIFTAANLNHRCFIDECDDAHSTYQQSWLQRAIPFKGDGPQKCTRFGVVSSEGFCNTTLFNLTQVIKCDRFIFEHEPDATIAKEFNIVCDENLWELTLVGSVNTIGTLIGYPLAGYVSDRYGRLAVSIISALGITIPGLLKSFTTNYITFLILELVLTSFSAGAFSALYILIAEMLTPKGRVLGSTMMSSGFGIGQATLGLAAMYTTSWRTFLRILHIPGFIFLTYFWFTDESVRWLLSKNRVDEAEAILEKIAKENGRKVNTNTLKLLENDSRSSISEPVTDLFKIPLMLGRFASCLFCWMSCNFVFYGMLINSIAISSDSYLNFIAVVLIEIPAYISKYYLLNTFGRRHTVSNAFIISGLACISFIFIPAEYFAIKMMMYLLGTLTTTLSFTTMYLYTTELFPTSMRHFILSCCITAGSVGTMMSQQVPLLAAITKWLPLVLFGVMSITAGFVALVLPETSNITLPATLAEAVNIGESDYTEDCDIEMDILKK